MVWSGVVCGLGGPQRRSAMLTLVGWFFASLLVPVASSALADAERRVALVIGNSGYEGAPDLKNPTNDANAIAESLKRLDFEVRLLLNARKEELREALAGFVDLAQGADWALVYFSGHGMELNGDNYLIPTDAQLLRDAHVRFEAIHLEDVLAAVGPARKMRLVILDACRNNPFRDRMALSKGTKSVGKGLARVEPDSGTLVAYAARDGQLALDGDGPNSPYTRALLELIEQPGLEVDLLFRRVRASVLEETGSQEPWTYGSMPPEPLYFQPGLTASPPVIAPEVLQFIELAESETLLGEPEEIDSLLRAEAKVSEDTRAALVGTELRDRFTKAERMADRALSIVVASDGKLKVMSRALDGDADVSSFLAAAGALTSFDLLWAEFRSKNLSIPYLPNLPAPERRQATELAERVTHLNTQLAYARQAIQEAQREIQEHSARAEETEKSAQALRRDLEKLSKRAAQSETERQALDEQIERLKKVVSEAESRARAAAETRDRFLAIVTQQQTELTALREKARELEGESHCTFARDDANRILGWSAYGTAYGGAGSARWSNESLNFEIVEGGERLARPAPGNLIKARKFVHVRRCFPDVPFDIASDHLLEDEELPPKVNEHENFLVRPGQTFRIRYVASLGGGRYWVALERPTEGFFVQVGAYSTEPAALEAYRALQERFPLLLGGRQADIKNVRLGGDAATYLARVTPGWQNFEEAVQFCTSLKEAQPVSSGAPPPSDPVECFVTLN